MKTQIKRLSKSTLAVIMAICMLFSCLMVGTITATGVAPATGLAVYGDVVGDWDNPKTNNLKFDSSGYALFTAAKTQKYYFKLYETDWGVDLKPESWNSSANEHQDVKVTVGSSSATTARQDYGTDKAFYLDATAGIQYRFVLVSHSTTNNANKVTFKIEQVAAADPNYYVVGQEALVNGSDWTKKQAADKMTKQSDGTYKWTSSSTRNVQEYRFRICDDSDYIDVWGQNKGEGIEDDIGFAYGETNTTYFTPKNNGCTITIIYNPNTRFVTVSASGGTTPTPTTGKIYVVKQTDDDIYMYSWGDHGEVFSGRLDGGTDHIEYYDYWDKGYAYTVYDLYEGDSLAFKFTDGKGYERQTETVTITFGYTYYVFWKDGELKVSVVKNAPDWAGGGGSTDPDPTPGDGEDPLYSSIFKDSNKNSNWHILTNPDDNNSSPVNMTYRSDVQAYKSGTNDYYFKVPLKYMKGSNGNTYFMAVPGTSYTACDHKSNLSSVKLTDRAKQYLQLSGNGGIQEYYVGSDQYKFPVISYKVDPTGYADYLVVHYNSSNKTYEIDLYIPSGSSGGGDKEEEVKQVDIYAKDGALRNTYNRFAELADTKIVEVKTPDGKTLTPNHNQTSFDGNNFNSKANYDSVLNVPVGSKITIETTLDSDANNSLAFNKQAFSTTHYVRGYSINGMTYEVYSPNSTGKYTMTWTVEDVNTKGTRGDKTIEITPVFYLQNATNTKTFYIEGYAGDVEDSWGNSLYVYPYYNNTSKDQNNAFGGYPGQPMLFWGGKYQTQIPLTVTGASTGQAFRGITLSNGFWDELHVKLDTTCSKGHKQTYDYDDFQKINQEKKPQTIYFWFKYRTNFDNFQDGGDNRGTYDFAGAVNSDTANFDNVLEENGTEVLTDYYGRQVDIFGTRLTTTTPYKDNGAKSTLNGTELLVISNGYKSTYIGDYSTLWAVYKQSPKGSFTLLGYITPGLLYLKEWDNVKDYDDSSNKAAGRLSWDMFVKTYTTLKQSYTGKPVVISYEKEITNSTGNVAARSDGKWYYSMGNETITAKTKIQYSDSLAAPDINSEMWTDDPYSTKTVGVGNQYNQGTTTGCNAYFTNTNITDANGIITYKTTAEKVLVDNNKFFTFQAQAADGWLFVGWVRQNQNGELSEITSTGALGTSNVSANDTYIARFIQAETGNLKISHNVRQNEEYKGNGTQYLKVEVINASTKSVEATYEATDGSDIDVSRYINSANYGTYIIRITLSTKPDKNCHFGYRMCTNPASKFGFAKSKDASQYTVGSDGTYTDTIEFTVNEYIATKATSLRYRTYLTRDTFTYDYVIKYHYESRYYGEQAFTRDGTLTDNDDEFFNVSDDNKATLTVDFIRDMTPYENSFRHTPNWNYSSNTLTVDDPDQGPNGKSTAKPMTQSSVLDGTTYTITVDVYAAYEIDDVVRATFRLPYLYNADDMDHKSATGIKFTNEKGSAVSDEVVYVYDESIESFDVATRIGYLFEPDEEEINLGEEELKSWNYKLVQAAPYVYVPKDGVNLTYALEDGTPVRYPGTYTSSTGQVLEPNKSMTLSDGSRVDQKDGYYFITPQIVTGVVGDEKQFDKWYFTRWDIYTTDGDFVASCFYPDFNYSGFENYIVIPVYETKNEGDPPKTHPRDDNYNSDSVERSGDISATITYLGDTRNQWNKGDSGDAKTKTTWAREEGDVIYSDFNLSFNYFGKEINKVDKSEAEIKYGLVFERLDGGLTEIDGTYVTDDEFYAQHYGATYDESKVQGYVKKQLGLTNESSRPDSAAAAFIQQLGDNTNDNISKSLTNKNRIRFTNSFIVSCDNKGTPALSPSQMGEQMYVYRVHAYIVVANEVTVSAPVYFTIYATAQL